MANNNIVLSWKLPDDKKNRYAYIYPDENGKRVRGKVNETDIETSNKWSYIEQYVKDIKTYSENFTAMCDEIRGLNLTAPIWDDNFYEYVNFIFSRFECYLIFVGFIILILSLFIKGGYNYVFYM